MDDEFDESEIHNSNIELTHEEALELFDKNKGLAESFAKKYYKTGYWEFDHALQIAYEGLWKACVYYRPSKGFQLSTLAWRIMTNRFIEEQKEKDRQPKIQFSLDDYEVSDGTLEGNMPLGLFDVLSDEKSNLDRLEENDKLLELKYDIIYILNDIAEELKLPKRTVKTAYMCLNESLMYKNPETKEQLKEITKLVGIPLVRKIRTILQERLQELDYN